MHRFEKWLWSLILGLAVEIWLFLEVTTRVQPVLQKWARIIVCRLLNQRRSASWPSACFSSISKRKTNLQRTQTFDNSFTLCPLANRSHHHHSHTSSALKILNFPAPLHLPIYNLFHMHLLTCLNILNLHLFNQSTFILQTHLISFLRTSINSNQPLFVIT